MLSSQEILMRESTPARLAALVGGPVYERSLHALGDGVLFLFRRPQGRGLGFLSATPCTLGLQMSLQSVVVEGERLWLGIGDLSHANAVAVRQWLPFTAPVRVGLAPSIGLGDRLGLATPGHVRAMRHGKGLVPVFAQQSMREMERTGRTPHQVMDDATWGVLQEGWYEGYGADADHLKSEQDIDACLAAEFILYTLDLRDHIDSAADVDSLSILREKYANLSWHCLESTPEKLYALYAGRSWYLGVDHRLALSEETFLRAACKYGAAVAHVRTLYEHLRASAMGRPWEIEISVDETETPTHPAEHLFLAMELHRLGVEWVSLAPRFVGRFEKGVDYRGNLSDFECDFKSHMAVAKAMGPYKLSLHSGSDKFSLYPIVAQYGEGLFHLKTAGTSYLEALRVIARFDPPLFREIMTHALQYYEVERRSYHVSAALARVPNPAALADEALESLLEQADARQVLHVTFGAVLQAADDLGKSRFRERITTLLWEREEDYAQALENHLKRHIVPLISNL